MGQGMGLAAAGGAGAAAKSLEDILAKKRFDQIQNAKMVEDQRKTNMENQIQQGQLDLGTRVQNRQDEAERRAEAASTQQREYLNALVNDPSIPEPVRQAVRYHLGTGQNPPADLFKPPTPDRPFVVGPGGNLVGADGKPLFSAPPAPQRPISVAPGGTLFDPVTNKPTYTAPERPLRIQGAADDPTLPLGAQRYIANIVTKHGGDFHAAQAELGQYLSDPQTLAQHPHLSAVKAMEALKRVAGAPGGAGDPLDALIAQASANLGGGPPAPSGQRGAVPGALRIARGAQAGRAAPPGGAGPDAQLVERARQVLQQGGYDTSDANVQKFLSIPANRQKLGGQ